MEMRTGKTGKTVTVLLGVDAYGGGEIWYVVRARLYVSFLVTRKFTSYITYIGMGYHQHGYMSEFSILQGIPYRRRGRKYLSREEPVQNLTAN
jgi:hypothetical protein